MQKVIIIGCPGAGKSTFARKLHKATGLPLYHLDMLWHKPDKTNYTREEFDRSIAEIMARKEWIIDGNYSRTLEIRLRSCDTVFLLDFSTELCMKSVENRIGTRREDMPWVETELDEEFRQWILDFPKEQLPEIYRLLDKYKEAVNVIVFKTREELERYLCNI